ncbi:MAG: hypothetical protein V7676_03185 [Parasphingorhabdus sp.]|uniref:hypothetical protein n=1 Tax=Parasphingorhabdus sp. TaxID=2709688 RepID=UPI003003A1DD
MLTIGNVIANHVRVGGAIALLAGTCSFAMDVPAAHAAGTLAGTDIVNIAQASYDGPSGPITVDSNPVTIKVDELLDVSVVSGNPGDVSASPSATSQVLTYQVTNTGNGTESFTLTADTSKTGDDFDATFEQIIIDDGNGVYDPGVDTVYTAGANDPVLAPDVSVTIFILSTIPDTANDAERAEVALSAVANTGSGNAGDVIVGQGDGGGDAVVGSTGANAEDSGFFIIQAADVSLVKNAIVVDQFGGAQPVPGATITYQLVATAKGSGTLTNLVIADNIPTDATYVDQSITLEGSALTDEADTDTGAFDGSKIAVALGSVSGGQSRTITFQVTID